MRPINVFKWLRLMIMLLVLGGWTEIQAENVSFVTRSWTSTNETVTATTENQESGEIVNSTTLTLDEHTYWHVKGENVVVTGVITVGKEVHLILCDGAKLTCQQGIRLLSTGKLHIHGQSGDTGLLVVGNSNTSAAGIGSHRAEAMGELFIHGGEIQATGGKYGAGIGGGEDADNGPVTIYSGRVITSGGKYAAGIGGGYAGSQAGAINIYGGYVQCTGGDSGAGIGGGKHWRGGSLGGTVTVYHAEVHVQGGKYAAGIGGGEDGRGGETYIRSGQVTATGGLKGAGIGGGLNGDGNKCYVGGNSTDATATVTAQGGDNAAGIGGGYNGAGGTTEIGKGCTVDAKAGNGCNGEKSDGGSAIGCGEGKDNKNQHSSIILSDQLCVYSYKTGETQNINTIMPTGLRIDHCRWRNWVKVMPCEHGDKTYYVDVNNESTYHVWYCKYCNTNLREQHQETDCPCSKNLGQWIIKSFISGTLPNYAEASEQKVYITHDYSLPTPTQIEGLAFLGWLVNPASAPTSCIQTETETLKQAGETLSSSTVQTFNIYARYKYIYTDETWVWSDDMKAATVTLRCAANNQTVENLQATTSTETIAATKDELGYKFVDAEVTYNGQTFTDFNFDYLLYAVSLADQTDNSEQLTELLEGNPMDITLTGRTLYKDDSWNTLCLPFDVDADELKDTPLSVATIMEMNSEQSGFDSSTGALTLSFTTATKIASGKPYLVKWASGDNVTAPNFYGFSIASHTPQTVTSSDGKVSMVGTFAPVAIAAGGDNTKLILTAANKMYYPAKTMTIGCQRAYFQLNGITAGNKANSIRLLFDNATTDISLVKHTELSTADADGWYTLDGRKLSGKPSQKGLYIYKGNKFVIK